MHRITPLPGGPVMQTYKTVAEIVGFLETYHGQLYDYYQKHRKTEQSQRLKMLIDYISRHNKNIQDVLKTIHEQDRDIIFKTWIQFVPFTETMLPPEKLTAPGQNIDSIVQLVFELDEQLIRFYDKMIHQAGIPEPVKNFFQQLITLEEKEKTQVAKAAQQIKSL
jgi:hypothetical protein